MTVYGQKQLKHSFDSFEFIILYSAEEKSSGLKLHDCE